MLLAATVLLLVAAGAPSGAVAEGVRVPVDASGRVPGRPARPLGHVGQADDVARRLAELSAPSADARAAAERWLSAHLSPGDRDAVARAAVASGAEGRRRLGRAVGAEGRLLPLAAALAIDARPAVAEVGLDAIRELALGWSARLAEPPLTGDELALALQRIDSDGVVRLLSADLGGPLTGVVELLRRSGETPLDLVVDPAIAERAESRAIAGSVPYVAGSAQLVVVLAGMHGLALSGYGLGDDGGESRAPFLLYHAPDARAGAPEENGIALVQRWARIVAREPATPGDPALRETGRRRRMEALLATGWPAAWDWIGALDAGGDAEAGEALVAAASGGIWPPAWRGAERFDALLAKLRLLQADGFEARAGMVARALGSAPARLADGTATAERIGAAWSDAGARERRHLLVALEGIGAAGTDAARDAWQARLRALLADDAEARDARLARQALRAWDALFAGRDVAPLELRAPLVLLREPWSSIERRELVALLVRSGGSPSGDDAPPAEAPARATLFEWLAGAGEIERASALMAAETSAGEAMFADALRRMVARGEAASARAIAAHASALDGKDGKDGRASSAARIAFLAGLADSAGADARAEWLAAAVAGDDLALLRAAAAVAGEAGAPVRERLVELVGAALDRDAPQAELVPLLQAVEDALAGLLRAGADGDARDLRRKAAGRVLAAPRGGMQPRLAAAGWPQFPPPLDVLDLDRFRRP